MSQYPFTHLGGETHCESELSPAGLKSRLLNVPLLHWELMTNLALFTQGGVHWWRKRKHKCKHISLWKWPWRKHKQKQKHKHMDHFFLFLMLALMLVKTKYRSGITQAPGYIYHTWLSLAKKTMDPGYLELNSLEGLLVLVFASNFVSTWVIPNACICACACDCVCLHCLWKPPKPSCSSILLLSYSYNWVKWQVLWVFVDAPPPSQQHLVRLPHTVALLPREV